MTAQDDKANQRIPAAFPRRGAVYVLAAIVLSGAMADLFLFDRWSFSGQVLDENGRGVPRAAVLAEFSGEGPIVVIPAPPDPPSRHERCMGSRLAIADDTGHFKFSVFTRNRLLVHKTAQVIVYKPGFNVRSQSVAISSSLYSSSPTYTINLKRDESSQNASMWSQSIGDRLQPLEVTYSDSLLASTRVVTEGISVCGRAGLSLAIRAMQFSIENAMTFDERDRVRSACGFARMRVRQHAHNFGEWPFNCDNLPFKHQPSPEVLAIEAELEAKRKAAAEHTSSAAASATTASPPQ